MPLQTRLQAEERVRKIRGQPFEQRTIRLVLARKTEHKLRLDIMPTLANAVLHTNDELEQPSNALAVRGDDPVSLLMAFSRAITRPRTGQAIVLRAIIAEHDLHDGGKQQVVSVACVLINAICVTTLRSVCMDLHLKSVDVTMMMQTLLLKR